jgi:hypothetical protein
MRVTDAGEVSDIRVGDSGHASSCIATYLGRYGSALAAWRGLEPQI